MIITKVIKRSIFNDLVSHLDKKEISLIIGPRQVGKTTLMNFMKDYLDKRGKKSVYLSLDFENDQKYFDSQNNLVNKLKLEFGGEHGYVFLDEIQRKTDAGIFLKGIYDMNLPYKFIISGSGSVELKEKVHESLAGRKLLFEVLPVSFFEFLNFETDYRYEEKFEEFLTIEENKTLNTLERYLNFGGYPRIILSDTLEEKARIIDEIFRSYVEKDISTLLRVEKLDVFRLLVKILAGQISGLINHSEISNTLGISLATVKNYLYYLEKTYIIKRLDPFYRNVRKEITKSPTVYFHDLGLRNYALGIFGNVARTDDFGFLFQNLVFNILQEKIKFTGAKINYWRTKDRAEVDFIYSLGETVVPIEVKYRSFSEPSIERSLRSFIDKYNPQKAVIVTRDFEAKFKIEKTDVIFIPFWLLPKFSI